MTIPFAFMSLVSGGIISGADGDLVINNGQTVDVAEGSVKQYNSITINTGGTLRITGNTGAWTEIGCKNNCIINGTITARAGYDGQATHSGGTFSKTSAFGLGSLSYTITQQPGGAGGTGGNSGRSGGLSTGSGIGGGGGGVGSNGGAGGSNGASGETAVAPAGSGGGFGNGNSNTGGVGSNAGTGGSGGSGGGGGGAQVFPSTIYYNGGAGSGYKGHHGKGVVIYVEGNISGSGSIILSGRNGFIGGNAVNASGNAVLGGGGGGGAGGSGGSLILRYKTGTVPSYSISGGTGGNGGSGFGAGSNGSNGQAGSFNILTI